MRRYPAGLVDTGGMDTIDRPTVGIGPPRNRPATEPAARGRLTRMSFASALSEHPVASHATGEVAGAVLEAIGDRPDLAVVTVTRPHAGALEDIVRHHRRGAPPTGHRRLCGGVGGGHRPRGRGDTGHQPVGRPGRAPGAGGPPCHPAGRRHLALPRAGPSTPPSTPAPWCWWPIPSPSRPTSSWPGWEPTPGCRWSAGTPRAAGVPAGAAWSSASEVVSAGAVGVLLGPGVDVDTARLAGWPGLRAAPSPSPGSDRNIIYEVAGVPAMECMVDQIRAHLVPGRGGGHRVQRPVRRPPIDEHVDRARTGRLPGPQRARCGPLHRCRGRGRPGPPGQHRPLPRPRRRDRPPGAAHAAGRPGRPKRPWSSPATAGGPGCSTTPITTPRLLQRALGSVPVGGFFAAGEIGPVGGHNFVHGFAASVALLRER